MALKAVNDYFKNKVSDKENHVEKSFMRRG